MQNGNRAFALVDRKAPAWQRWCAGVVERLTGLRGLDEVARNLDRRLGVPTARPTAKAWLGAARDWLRLDLDLPDGDLERVPRQVRCWSPPNIRPAPWKASFSWRCCCGAAPT